MRETRGNTRRCLINQVNRPTISTTIFSPFHTAKTDFFHEIVVRGRFTLLNVEIGSIIELQRPCMNIERGGTGVDQTMRDRILTYIENMAPGDRITIKTIAQELGAGTEIAYQVIREAELTGLLQFRTAKPSATTGTDFVKPSSIPVLSTNVSEKDPLGEVPRRLDYLKKTLPKEESPETLTLRIISQITEAQVCCGQEHLNRQPSKFVIAAMDLRAMANYLKAGSLCIVGNRPDAQMLALENKSSLLITGNLYPSPEVLGFAQETGCPIMVSPYETFLVASLINLALYAEYEKIVFIGGELLPHQRPEEEDIEQRFTIDFKFEKASVLTGVIHPWMVNSAQELKSWVLKYLLEFSQTTYLCDHNLNAFSPESFYLSEIKPAQLGERIRLTSRLIAKQKNGATLETEVTGERGAVLAKSISVYSSQADALINS
jgi:predicted transcriptional regulator